MKQGKQTGYTIVELLVVVCLIAIMSYVAIANIKRFSNPSNNAAANLAAFLKESRQRAMSSTQAYLVQPVNANMVKTSYASTCSATTFTEDTSFKLSIKNPAKLTLTTWSICYSPRGLADNSANITIQDGSTTRTVQVVLGGAVRIL